MTKQRLLLLIESWEQGGGDTDSGACPSEALYDAAVDAGCTQEELRYWRLKEHLLGMVPCAAQYDKKLCLAVLCLKDWCEPSGD